MADGTQYIIMPPPEDSGVTLQELIEGLQTGRIVISGGGGGDVVLNAGGAGDDGDQQVPRARPPEGASGAYRRGGGVRVLGTVAASRVNHRTGAVRQSLWGRRFHR